jgi:hypothetical protein
VFESIELKSPDVRAREKIIARGVLGKRLNILSAIQECKFVFSTAIASKKPPKNKNIIGLEKFTAVALVSKIEKAGKSTMGSKDTTAKGKPSFVHSVTSIAMSPSKDACVMVKILIEIAKTTKAIKIAKAIFLAWLISIFIFIPLF